MKWEDFRRSDMIEDRRSESGTSTSTPNQSPFTKLKAMAADTAKHMAEDVVAAGEAVDEAAVAAGHAIGKEIGRVVEAVKEGYAAGEKMEAERSGLAPLAGGAATGSGESKADEAIFDPNYLNNPSYAKLKTAKSAPATQAAEKAEKAQKPKSPHL